jgi:cell division protein FtsX
VTTRRYSTPPVGLLEVLLTVLGGVFIVLSALCVIATLTVLLSWGDPSPGFPAGERFVGFTKGFGLVFFPIAALVTFATGWWLAGAQIRRMYRRLRTRD